ncbi:MAG: peptidoglycan bridge formation glycyltransferase FemA/FemB family protein, partial [Syntrophorhabdaceae bacterium]|nr:peptidoglycan bridge formation glycyltransferase FemA/FemB family protein [Syntrophorhabdaceae bacterium]
CLTYDMGAVAPSSNLEHPFFGMYRFKTGFGGKIIHRGGTWDYPLINEEYMVLRNAEMLGTV